MADLRGINRRLLYKLVVIALLMFGFGFALVPFYEKICEATGIRNLFQPDKVAENTQVDVGRTVTIEFDANLQGELPWYFKPMQNKLRVHPGELAQVAYEIENRSGRAMVAQAVPSYGPTVAGQYFNKLECFCFKQQRFQAGEKRQMQVVFVIDPALPKEVETITLSYSFFEVAGTALQSK